MGDIRENQKTAEFIFEDLMEEIAFTDVLQFTISEEELLHASIRNLSKTANKTALAVYNINRQ